MDRAGRHAILGAVVLTVIAVATWRDRPAPPEAERRPVPVPAPPPVIAAPPSAPVVSEPAPASSVEGTLTNLRRGSPPPLSKDVLTGSLAVEGSGRADLVPPDLPLSPSQQTLVDGLLRERNAALDAIRREAASAPQTRESAAALAAKAREAHESCVASIRDGLLPDQRAAFDDLIRSGRWGGYVLVIPTSR